MNTPGYPRKPILGPHPVGAESVLPHPLDQRDGRLAERRPAGDQGRDVPVLALVHHLAPRVGRAEKNSGARQMAAVQERHRLLVHQRPHDAGLHVDDDSLAEPVDSARVVRHHHRDRRLAAGVQSGLRQTHLQRRLSLLAHQVHLSAGRPRNDVGPGVVFARTRVAERRDRRVDEARIFLGERLVAQTDRVEITQPMRLDEEVGLRRQVGDECAPVFSGEVGGYGFFPRVIGDRIEAVVGVGDIVEIGRDPPRRAAGGRFDLDNFGAEIGEHLAAQRALLVGQIEQPQSSEQL